MKKLLWTLVFLAIIPALYAQRSIDDLFRKYAGKDGFVTVTVNGNLLRMFRSDEKEHWPGKVTEVRILVQDDESLKVENFYDLVMKDLNVKDYEEYMRIKNSDEDLRMLVKTEGNTVREFLLVGGGEDNLLIQVRGKMTFQEAEDFSSEMRKDHGKDLTSDLN
ncbi:MAG: DUF4252 domain-containing protein [Bacteroidales bacterium]